VTVPRRSPTTPSGARFANAAAPRSLAVARPRYRLTVRRGAAVERHRFERLDEALEAAGREIERVRDEGPLKPVKALRSFTPADRVAARVEITSGGWMRQSAAGCDVMGDGRVVAFSGGVGRRPLEPAAGEAPLELVRRELENLA
jgi:hypothetical protein